MNSDKPRFHFSPLFHFFLYTVLIGSFAGYVYWEEMQKELEIEARIQKTAEHQKEIEAMNDDELEAIPSDHNCSEVVLAQGFFISKEDPKRVTPMAVAEKKVDMQVDIGTIEQDTQLTKSKDRVTCYDMYQGSYFVPNSCRDRIKKYVNKHKDAHHFEVTAVIDRMEFKVLRALSEHDEFHDQLFVDDEELKRLKKFTQAGLAKYRAMEASWIIKAATKDSVKSYNANYQIVSNRGYKGVIIQAYK